MREALDSVRVNSENRLSYLDSFSWEFRNWNTDCLSQVFMTPYKDKQGQAGLGLENTEEWDGKMRKRKRENKDVQWEAEMNARQVQVVSENRWLCFDSSTSCGPGSHDTRKHHYNCPTNPRLFKQAWGGLCFLSQIPLLRSHLPNGP